MSIEIASTQASVLPQLRRSHSESPGEALEGAIDDLEAVGRKARRPRIDPDLLRDLVIASIDEFQCLLATPQADSLVDPDFHDIYRQHQNTLVEAQRNWLAEKLRAVYPRLVRLDTAPVAFPIGSTGGHMWMLHASMTEMLTIYSAPPLGGTGQAAVVPGLCFLDHVVTGTCYSADSLGGPAQRECAGDHALLWSRRPEATASRDWSVSSDVPFTLLSHAICLEGSFLSNGAMRPLLGAFWSRAQLREALSRLLRNQILSAVTPWRSGPETAPARPRGSRVSAARRWYRETLGAT